MANSKKISSGTLSYICARNRQQAYNTVIRELKKSGMTQADLARRIDKGPDIISRLLKRPQNWELNTFSELLYGICGAALKFAPDFPNRDMATGLETGTPSSDVRLPSDFYKLCNFTNDDSSSLEGPSRKNSSRTATPKREAVTVNVAI